MTGPEPAPYLRIVRGEPTDEEVAALVVAVAALAASAADRPAPPRSEWSSPHRRVRGPAPVPARPGAWRSSGLPR